MPEWIIKELMRNNSVKEVEQICKNSNLKPKVTIRVNKLKLAKNELMNRLKKENIEYKELNKGECLFNDFLILNKIKNIENLDLFENGYFTIQDISAGLTAKILNPKPGEQVLDACSAPGGKTTYLAELMENKGNIEAWDIHEHRTKLVQQNAKRLGIDIITTRVKDASIYYKNLNEKFDKILLDVPCLGIGVIKRKPDIKWQRKVEDIQKITKIQKQILENCSKYLKPGGELVYSTCSILKEENENIIFDFLSKNKNFNMVQNSNMNIIPDEEKDGFFICKLYKKEL